MPHTILHLRRDRDLSVRDSDPFFALNVNLSVHNIMLSVYVIEVHVYVKLLTRHELPPGSTKCYNDKRRAHNNHAIQSWFE